MKNWLYNKNVIITGASGGIGFNIAKILIQKYDCHVYGIARNEKKIINAINELGDKKQNFSYEIFDINDIEKYKYFVKSLEEKGIIIDILINNAGFMLPFDKLENYSEKDVEDIINTNFISHINVTKNTLKLLNKSFSPAIVNISSAAGLCAVIGQTMYCATKFGMKGFTDTLRLELGKKFYVSGVYPGFIKTNILHRMSINDKNNRLIEKFMKPVDKATKIIVKKLSKKKKHIVLGIDGKSMAFISRLFPKSAPNIIKGVLKASKLEMFNDVFK